MNILEVENLSKDFGSFRAVNEVNFTIARGEIFGFLGPNGAGKTTTINMLTGLARPTSGSITIAGQDGISNIKKVQRIIGIVPDESNLYDDMSGWDNLVFCASLYGMDKATRESEAQRLLQLFGLDDTGSRLFKAYSKGMKRKLTIAAGIIHSPEILFLDEPTTGIDVESARQIRQLIVDLNHNGTTIFLTTHYIEEAERLCHRVGFIVNGKVVRIGTVEELMREAQQENVVEFVVDNDLAALQQDLSTLFSGITVKGLTQHAVRISSADPIDLMPFMKFFDANDILVREARIVHPSLEDVFVRITGIERDKMNKEKEGVRI